MLHMRLSYMQCGHNALSREHCDKLDLVAQVDVTMHSNLKRSYQCQITNNVDHILGCIF